jgi:hypothetical protein
LPFDHALKDSLQEREHLAHAGITEPGSREVGMEADDDLGIEVAELDRPKP